MLLTVLEPRRRFVMNTDLQRLLTVPEAAERLSIGETMAYEWIKAGKLPSLRLGRAIRVPAQALGDWIVARTQSALEATELAPPLSLASAPPPRRGPRPKHLTGRLPTAVMARRRGAEK